ncbi:MAG TPA: amidohydrolase family protein [Acidimicrobiales bacterium]|nr:amidohydrolase family protein [Acidimicrobiales bacterium]
MSETWDSIDRYVIISADTHAGAELHEYKQYLDPEWHEEFEAWAQGYSSPYDDLVDATASRNWDSDYRRSELEKDGISAEVVFPNTIPPFFNTIHSFSSLPWERDEFERRAAGLKAHNRWLVEFCGKAPDQRRGLIQIFPHDVDMAVEEIRWAKESGVIGGVLLPAIPANHKVEPWFHTRYEPLWAVCQELELPVHQHPGTGGPEVGADQPAAPAVMLFEFTYWTRRTLAHLMLAGVFERYPRLKAVWTEQGISWAAQDLMMLDYNVANMKADAENRTSVLFGSEVIQSLSLKPSEYFARNCYLGASFLSRLELKFLPAVGPDRVMWGTDFPHEEGTTPYSREALRATFADMSVEQTRRILAGTAAEVYGFDLDALTAVAKRVGPTVEEIHTPLTEIPPSNSQAFIGLPLPKAS